MKLFEGKTPAERNKLILAIGSSAVALLFLAYNLGFFSSSKKPTGNRNARAGASRATGLQTTVSSANTASAQAKPTPDQALIPLQPIRYDSTSPKATDVGRNIFAYYIPPPKPATPRSGAPSPSPTPVPPSLILASVTPTSVYARTGDFTLEVSGDKFTSATGIFINGQELPTRFNNAQSMAATVPAALIASEGAREVVVRTADATLFSNPVSLNVAAAPTPPYSYVGIVGGKRYNDTAVLKDRSGQLLNVQRGDLVGGRFRVTSISERGIEFTDSELSVKHTLEFTDKRLAGGAATSRQ